MGSPPLRVDRLGDRAVRVERPAGVPASALFARARALDGVIDAVVTERHVALYFQGDFSLDGRALEALASPGRDADVPAPREHALAARFDGEDLAWVAHQTGSSEREVALRFLASAFEVAMMGFAPGFAYLSRLDARLHLPRRHAPRTNVPAGAIAIGGPYAGVYPRASPGGWHIIGRVVGVSLFDAASGALLSLGDRVRFVEAL